MSNHNRTLERESARTMARRKIATLMADGRERTADAIAYHVPLTVATIRHHLLAMTRMGLLKKDRIDGYHGLAVWRSNVEAGQ